MLRELRIKNLAIIDNVAVTFGDGLNVLTGETGAGKSIIISALCLALGERASSDLIRSGESQAVVETFFDVPSLTLDETIRERLRDIGIDCGGGILMKRILSANGKSRAYINDSMVNVQTLSEVSRTLIDIHGQYEHQSLLSPDTQLELLDAFGGITDERQEFSSLYLSLTELREKVAELERDERERAQRLDLLRFQVDEIDSAGLGTDEEAELSEQEKILGSAGRLAELANQAYEYLYSADSACLDNVAKVISSLKEIAAIDMKAGDALASVEGALPLLEDSAFFLRDYKDSLDFDPGRLEEIRERIELIRRLKKKYGGSIREILDFREHAAREIHAIEHSGERAEALTAERDVLEGEVNDKADRLTGKRKNVAKKLEQHVMKELGSLSMSNTKFVIEIGSQPQPHVSGKDRIDFLISPNVGEVPRPLSKIASGGELSRVMLALKGILARGDNIPVLIFDEVDAGIGGRTAETVGRKLDSLSSDHQVICVTHLPQIASFADRHIKIEKKIKGKRTSVVIREVEENERTREIARMLGGDSSAISLEHAREILKKKAKVKVQNERHL